MTTTTKKKTVEDRDCDERLRAMQKQNRKEVEDFADSMEEQLRENDHKGGWKDSSTRYLSDKLLEEVAELLLSLDSQDFTDEQLMDMFREKIQRLRMGESTLSSPAHEAADVGNVSMMLADPERVKFSETEGEAFAKIMKLPDPDTTKEKPSEDWDFEVWLSGYADIRLLRWGKDKPFIEIILHSADAEKVKARLGIDSPLITSSAGYDYPSFKVGFFKHIPEAEKAVKDYESTIRAQVLDELEKEVEEDKTLCQDMIKFHGKKMGEEYVKFHDGRIHQAQETIRLIRSMRTEKK